MQTNISIVSSPGLRYSGASHDLKVSLLPNPSHLGEQHALIIKYEYLHIIYLCFRGDQPSRNGQDACKAIRAAQDLIRRLPARRPGHVRADPRRRGVHWPGRGDGDSGVECVFAIYFVLCTEPAITN